MSESKGPWPRQSGVSRRTVLKGAGLSALTAAGIGSLSACVPAAVGQGGAPELDFWHLLGGGDGARMTEILATVNAEMTDAQVKQTVLAWGAPYYTKLAMASAGGRAPDLAVVHMSRLPGYAPGGLLDPWDLDRLAAYDVGEASFTGPTWERSQLDGETFALALDSHAFVSFFNPEILELAGVLDPAGDLVAMSSIEDVIDVGRAIKEVTGTPFPLSYGFLGDGAQMWRLFWTFYTQHGMTFELEGEEFVYDQEAFAESLEAMRTLVDGEVASTSADYGTAISGFLNGDAGLILCGPWELPQFQDAGMPLGAAPIPNLFGTGIDAAWGDSHTFVLPHQNNPDEEKRELVYEAVSRILKNSLPWGSAGHTPAYQPVVNTPAFRALEPNAKYAETANYLQYDPIASFTGSGSRFQTEFGNSVQNALIGQVPTQEAMADFANRVNVLISKSITR